MVQKPIDRCDVGPSRPERSITLLHTGASTVPFGLFNHFCSVVGSYIWPLGHPGDGGDMLQVATDDIPRFIS